MAKNVGTTNYEWQPTSRKDLARCVKWCKEYLRLQSWRILLYSSARMPKEVKMDDREEYEGICKPDLDVLTSHIWIPLPLLVEDNRNPLEALIHEMLHTHHVAYRIGVDDDETSVRIISPLLYEKYCGDSGIETAKKK